MKMENELRLQVAVRIRPNLSSNVSPVVAADDINGLLASAATTATCFDAVFGPGATQHSIFSTCAVPLLDAMFTNTLNGCLFAFGQSGSGKTFSMLGASGGRNMRQLDGAIPRIADELFLRIARAQADSGGCVQFQVRACWLEVYEDLVYDLLPPQSEKRRPLEVRDSSAPDAQVLTVTSTSMLMDLIAQGSAQRACKATGIHDNSSRSHAVMTLTLERRWARGEGDVLRSCCSLQLVDLAGSESTDRAHNGVADRAGCSVNKGLLFLRRTLQALAAGAHVPYRSAALTKLLYPSLSGGSVTWMLATVSPEDIDAYETTQTLKYAKEARRLQMRPVAAAAVVDDACAGDPLLGDVCDSNLLLQRRCEWIQTATYGDVFARVAGDVTHPLLLMVHGSGPSNSSLQWNWLLQHMASPAQGQSQQHYFCVAIDCPGYGRTPGDRQTVRSYPGKFIAEVCAALGRSSAYALVGSSQGACAVLNAVLELPDIAHFVAVCHPVGHAPARYTAIQQPVLLAFDTEDAGHPVSVGRIMQRKLQRPHYFEFTASVHKNWLEENFALEMRSMFQSSPAPRNAGGCSRKMPYLARLGGGLHRWSKAAANEEPGFEVAVIESARSGSGGSGGSNAALMRDHESEDAVACSGTAWVALVDASGCVKYQDVNTRETRATLPTGARLHQAAASDAKAAALFKPAEEEDEGPQTEHAIRQKQLEREQLEAAEAAAFLSQTQCSRCKRLLHSPLVLRPCNHVQCGPCSSRFGKLFGRCCVCGVEVTAFSRAPAEMLQNLARTVQSTEGMAQQQQLQHQLLKTIQEEPAPLVFEFGNECSPCGPEDPRVRRSQTIFLRPLSPAAASALKHVSFNINPGYGAGVRVAKSAAAGGNPRYELCRSMTRAFPCFMTLVFSDKMPQRLRSLEIHYDTQHTQALFTRRVAIAAARHGDAVVSCAAKRQQGESVLIDGRCDVLVSLAGEQGDVRLEPN